ncbi:MAG: transposase [Lachnospiraceae bacterium]|nr:transposase [Lachnospiraceae bacterium]
MPRMARTMSISGYMHVIARGIGRQILFEETKDYEYYLERLERYCLETDVKVCAYCLMENHVHILLHGEFSSIILLMKKLGVSYSGYYNRKYDRSGHLFQDRYRSEPVDEERYLLTVFRYILQNPRKAAICTAADYRWSSYRYYEKPPAFMDLSAIWGLLGDRGQFERYIGIESQDRCLEYIDNKYDDIWAKQELKRCLGISEGTKLQNVGKKERNAALVKLKESGLTIRQIERLTGIGRNIVQKAGK